MSYPRWIFVAVFLFSVGLILGFTVGLELPGGIDDFLAEDLAALEQLVAILQPFQVSTAVFIFLKNASALLLSFLFSPILCLLPVLALTVNGWLLAFISAIVIEEESLGLLLAGLLPHGILELPALIIGEAAALSFGAMVMLALFQKEKKKRLLSGLKQNAKYLGIAIALLLPAAIIETYLTPLLLA